MTGISIGGWMLFQDMWAYFIERSQDFTTALSQHLQITFTALAIAVILGVLFGILGSRVGWLRKFLLNAGKIGNTFPTLAVLALALPLLGIGRPPTILALTFIGTLPVLINTLIGIEQVDANMKEAARGMGMRDIEVLFKVELPVAIAVIMAGIRTSAVVIVASTTFGGFIGAGGLGDLILRGHQLNRDHVMLLGAIPATILAFYFEEAFGRLETWVTPKGLKIGTSQRKAGGLIGLLCVVAAMPLLFGVLLPWETQAVAGSDPVVLTGLHAEYRTMGLPVLVLGLVATLWPRRGESGNAWPITLITFGTAAAAFVWLVFGLTTKIQQTPSLGLVWLIGAVLSIAVITGIELIISYYHFRATANVAKLRTAAAP
ncbi:MAG: ABC transporter permease [Cyanobacteria bacterium J06639_16]